MSFALKLVSATAFGLFAVAPLAAIEASATPAYSVPAHQDGAIGANNGSTHHN